MAEEEKTVIESPVQNVAMKKVYEAKKKAKEVTTDTKPTYPAVKTPSTLTTVGKGTDFKMGGYPEGVPPGANKTRWDYDDVSKKYLIGDAKESKRRTLWDNYRSIHKKQGRRASSFVKEVMSKPSVRSMKYG